MSNQTLRRFSLPFSALAWLASTMAAHAAQIVPGTFAAYNFDPGGEGLGYHENTPGNQGDAGHRTSEDVDIFVSNDPAGAGLSVKNFESGEWLAYTLSVPTGGDYFISLRASTHPAFPNSSYYVQIDGTNVTGTVTLPDTGGWDHYRWLDDRMISLTAGAHLLRIVAVTPYFNLDSIRIVSTSSPSPYYGAPVDIPGAFEAEAFDAGGEGSGYHDNTPGNQGDSGIRDGEDVDIFVTNDAQNGSPYIVKNLEAGEWLSYTIRVHDDQGAPHPVYYVEIRASTQADFPNPAYHLEVDDVNVTGAVVLPDTGGWDNYQWIGRTPVNLTPGTHVLKIVAERPYFMLNAISVDTGRDTAHRSPGDTAHALPGQIEAEDFAAEGEGLGYHEYTGGNQGDAGYRTSEDVDIFRSNDLGSGSWYIVKNFAAGEWLTYHITASPGIYTLELRASTSADFPQSAYHVQVNGKQATPVIMLPDTGGWDNYQWVGKTSVKLVGGSGNGLVPDQYTLSIVVDNPYFNLNTIRLTLP